MRCHNYSLAEWLGASPFLKKKFFYFFFCPTSAMVMISAHPTPAALGSCALLPPHCSSQQAQWLFAVLGLRTSPRCNVRGRGRERTWEREHVHTPRVAGSHESLLVVFPTPLSPCFPSVKPAVSCLPPFFLLAKVAPLFWSRNKSNAPLPCLCADGCCSTVYVHVALMANSLLPTFPISNQYDRHIQLPHTHQESTMPPMNGCNDREQTWLEMPVTDSTVPQNSWQPREAVGHAGRYAWVPPSCWPGPVQTVSCPLSHPLISKPLFRLLQT